MQGQHTDVDSPVSQTPRRSSAEFVGLAYGGACVASEWLLSASSSPLSPAATILPVIVASFLAGVTATFLTRETAGVRDGIRAGVVSALIGSASLVVLAVLQGDSLPGLLSVELLAILSFPPSVAVALIGAIAITFVRHPPELSPRPRVAAQSAASRGNLLFRVILGVALLGYLTPLFFLLQPATPEVVLSEAPSATPPPAIPSPTPVPWSYEKPTDFASLPGRSIGLVDQKQIQDIDGNLPMALACPRKSGRFKSRVLGGRRKAERT